MFKKSFCMALGCIALIVAVNLIVFGQDNTGSVVGTVKDSAGASVPGATVTLTIPSQGNRQIRVVNTDEDGAFSIPNVPVSVYTVTVEAKNFKKYVVNDVKVDVGQRRPVDVELVAGNISEVVTVEGGAVEIESSIPQVSTTINNTQISELSINNRNWVQFITLAPGVTNNLADLVPVGNFSPDGSPNIIAISVNGARQSQNTYTVDGADITDRGANITLQGSPSLDSIGEFKVLRSLYPAESGRSGGGQVNVITKSGTDKFHGSLFEFVRNEKLNANNFLLNRSKASGVDANGKAKRTPFRYNNYGFTIGGPVWMFNFGEHDPGDPFFARLRKTYFFFSEEQRKDRRYLLIGPSNVPTAGMRQGIFTNPICLRATLQTTPTTVRTCSQILPAGTAISTLTALDPTSAAYLQYIYAKMPLPDSGGTALSAFPDAAKFDFQQEVIKIDSSLTRNWTASYRYGQEKVPTYSPNGVNSPTCAVPGLCPESTNAPGRNHTFQTTYVVNPQLIIEGRYNHSFGGIFATTGGLFARANSPIPLNLPYGAYDSRVPNHTGFTTLSNIQGFGDWNNYSQKDNYTANVTWLPSPKHTMKFGVLYSAYHKVEDQLGGNPNGTYSSFSNTLLTSPVRGTVCVDATSTAIACPTGLQTTEQQFANFLMGQNVVFSQNKYNLTADFRQNNYEAYVQDEFRIARSITLYLGLRYSYFGPPWDKNGLLTNFVPSLYNASVAPAVTFNGSASVRTIAANTNVCTGLIVNSQQTSTLPNCTPTVSPYGKYVYRASKDNFAPRIGIAWDLGGKGRTIIRTGYGIYHDQVLLGNVELQTSNPVFQESVSFTGGTLSNPTPAGQTNAQSVATSVPGLIRGVPLNYLNPYMQHWSLDIQHVFGKRTFAQVGYYGSKGTHLIGIQSINNLPPGFALTQTCQITSTTTGPCQARDANNVPVAFTASNASLNTALDQIRPYRGYHDIALVKPEFNSTYHSLQVQATQRFTGDSQVQLSYTWSKNLTNSQTDRSSAAQTIYNVQAEYGRAQLDRRHVLTVNYVYEIPFMRAQKGFAGKVLGGWQVSGIGTYQTGIPFTPLFGASVFDPAGLGAFGTQVSTRPNITCDPNVNAPHTFDMWFNTACVQQTPVPTSAPAVVGTAGRGIIDGPPTRRFDVTLTKNIRWSERYKLQLKGEFFNVFNITNFTTFGTTASIPRTFSSTTGLASGFGVISGVRDPRTIQLGIKFNF